MPMTPLTFHATTAVPVGRFTKNPVERLPLIINMTRAVPSEAMLTRATFIVTDLADNTTVTGLVASDPISGFNVPLTVMAGIHGHRYKIAVTIRDNTNHLYYKTLVMIVRAT